MWLLHFIFEGRFFVYYFQNCRKDVTKNNAKKNMIWKLTLSPLEDLNKEKS